MATHRMSAAIQLPEVGHRVRCHDKGRRPVQRSSEISPRPVHTTLRRGSRGQEQEENSGGVGRFGSVFRGGTICEPAFTAGPQ